MMPDFDFYFITCRELSRKNDVEDVRAALRAGVKIVQYREKALPTKEMVMTAKKIKELCDESGALLIINDRVDVALAVDADGVHIGADDMPYENARAILGKKIIGLSARNLEEALYAQRVGADYMGFGPIFETKTKKDASAAQGLKALRKVLKSASVPVVAIGGITLENVREVVEAGARHVAAISATVGSDDVEAAVLSFRRIIAEYRY